MNKQGRVERLANRLMAVVSRHDEEIGHEAVAKVMNDLSFIAAKGNGDSVAVLYRMMADEAEKEDMAIH